MALLAVSAQLLEEVPIINATDNAGNANETSDCGMLVGNAASDCDCVGGSGPVFAIAPSPTRTASVPSPDVDDVRENYVDADGGVATEALNLCPTPLKQQCIAVMDRNAPAQLHAGFVLQPLLLDMMLVESDSAAAVGPDALMHADELMAHTTSDAMLESFSALRLHDRPSVSVVTSLLSSASTVNVAGAASHGHQEVVIHDGAGAVAGEHADETLFEDLEAATAATPGLPSLHAAPPLPDDDDDGDDAALAQNASPLSRLLRSVRLPFNATQSRSLLSRRRRAHAVRAGPGDEPLTVVVNQQLPHLEDDAPPPPPPPPPPPVSPQSPTATLVSAATADAPLSPRPRYAAAPTPGDKGKKFLTLLTDLPPAVYQQHQLEFAEIYSAPRRTRDAAAGVAALYMCPICWEARVLRDLVVVGDCGHSFCFNCLAEWIRKSSKCPYCRHQFEPKLVTLRVQKARVAHATAKLVATPRVLRMPPGTAAAAAAAAAAATAAGEIGGGGGGGGGGVFRWLTSRFSNAAAAAATAAAAAASR